MKKLWNSIWNLLYPACCVTCGQPLLQAEEYVCQHCFTSLPRTNFHMVSDNEMERNLWGKLPLGKASAFLFYAKGGAVSRILYDLKYYGHKEIGRMLGRCMASEMVASGFFQPIEFIVPIPLHPKREKERGYNQSEWLAKGISDITNIPLLNNVLVREHYTMTQTHKSQTARWENVQGLFRCINETMLKGKHILLVDDVMTTGATIVAAADALQGADGIQISVLTLALAGHD